MLHLLNNLIIQGLNLEKKRKVTLHHGSMFAYLENISQPHQSSTSSIGVFKILWENLYTYMDDISSLANICSTVVNIFLWKGIDIMRPNQQIMQVT